MPLDKIVINVTGQADLDSTIKKLLELGIIDEKNAKAFKKNSDSSRKEIDKTNNSLSTFNKTLNVIGPALAGAFAIGKLTQFGNAIISTTAKFEKFEAVLVNTLGSKSQAQQALRDIQEFAAKTPFSVAELTSSFVKLVNQGFKPTQVEMRKLGDIAASQGKSFDQLTEAIIDAQTGEFERLKEFGIRASKEGDKVKFTFKGVETQTKFTSASIRDYILSLGDAVGVSGSMAAISNTLGGKISNMDDAFDSLFNTIGSANSGVLKGSVELITEMVKGLELALTTEQQFQGILDNMVSSSRLNQYLGFLDEDAKKLEAVSDANEARRLVFASALLNLKKELDDTTKKLERTQKLFGPLLSDEQSAIIKGLTDDIQFYESALVKVREQLDKVNKGELAHIQTIESLRDQIKLLTDQRDKQTDISDVAKIQSINKEIEAIDELIKKLLGQDEATKNAKKAADEYAAAMRRAAEIAKELSGVTVNPKLDAEFAKSEQEKRKIIDERVKAMRAAMKKIEEIEEEARKKREKREQEEKLARQIAQDAVVNIARKAIDFTRDSQKRRSNEEIQAINDRADAEIDALQKKANEGVITQQYFESRKEQIQKKAAQKEAELKNKQAKDDRKFALASIAINTAIAAAKGIAQFGPPPSPAGIAAIASAIAIGAAETAIVLATPIPKFKDGVIDYKGKGTDKSDSNLVRISRGESVMTAEETRKYKHELEAMRKGNFEYRAPIMRRKSLSDARNESMADNIYKSLAMQNIFDDGRIVKALRENKKVDIGGKELASMIAAKIGDRMNENNLFK